MSALQIDAERFLSDLATLRRFGQAGTGVRRPAFSTADIDARVWLIDRMRDADLEVTVDPVGNVFGMPAGMQTCMLSGSHTDSQPEGGWLDGAFGVVGALEAARSIRQAGGPPVGVVSFQDEEGRFGALTGSSVWCGALALAAADRLTDADGTTFHEARQSVAQLCDDFVPTDHFTGFIEAHIEQGPVLDTSDDIIGVVEAIVGIRSLTLTLTGQQNHAGTTPMDRRRDAFQGLVAFTSRINNALADIVSPATVWTIGQVKLHPNAASIVPGAAEFTVQWRDSDPERLEKMETQIRTVAHACARDRGLTLTIAKPIAIDPIQCDPALVGEIAQASGDLVSGRFRHMISGALHDATNVSRLMPTAMLFVPSIHGISHSFAEDTRTEDLVAGAHVLANALFRAAA